jgi:hypothetical protein
MCSANHPWYEKFTFMDFKISSCIILHKIFTDSGSEDVKQPVCMKVMRTIPFVKDEPLLDASLLGFSI